MNSLFVSLAWAAHTPDAERAEIALAVYVAVQIAIAIVPGMRRRHR